MAKTIMQKTVYVGAGWFTPKQEAAYKDYLEAIADNPTIYRDGCYVPLEHQWHDIRVDEHPEYLHRKDWSTATFLGDINGINQTDIALFAYLPSEEDVGCGVEMGYAYGIGKPIVIIMPDDEFGDGINLMSWGTATRVIKMSELADFDFNNISYDFYDGAVY